MKHLAENIGQGFSDYFGSKVRVELADPFANANGLGNLLFSRIYNFFLYRNLAINSFLVQLSYITKPDCLTVVKWEVHNSLKNKLKNADLIVSTSPWVLEGVFHSLSKLGRKTPVMVYVADFGEGMYRGWFHKKATAYFTVTREASEILAGLGAPKERIAALGIPSFCADIKRKRAGAKLGRILIASGLHGSEEIACLAEAINSRQPDIHIDVLCGRSRELLRQLSQSKNSRIFPYGFVGKQKIMALNRQADLIVTKAGSLSIANAIAVSVPMLIIGYPSIMPQEKGNAKFVDSQKIGWICKSRAEIAEKIGQLSSNPEMLDEKRKSFARTAGFTDTRRICGTILKRAGIISRFPPRISPQARKCPKISSDPR